MAGQRTRGSMGSTLFPHRIAEMRAVAERLLVNTANAKGDAAYPERKQKEAR
jgi:hypothetical protein